MVAPNVRASFDTLAEGATVTSSTTGVDAVGGSGTRTALAAAAARGARGCRIFGDAVGSFLVQNIAAAQGTATAQQYFYYDSANLPSAGLALCTIRNATGGTATATLTTTGQFVVQDAGGTTRLNAVAGTLTTGWYVISMAVTKGTTTTNGRLGAWLRKASDGTLVVAAVDISNANTGIDDLTIVRHGKTGSGGTITYDMDEIAVGWGTFGELDLVSSVPDPIAGLTTTRLTNTTVQVAWTHPDNAPSGVSIARAAGTQVNDGLGRAPTDPLYDPMTISGASIVAQGLTSSPYTDTVPGAGTYTYWVARTA